jgi:hypothetical protein
MHNAFVDFPEAKFWQGRRIPPPSVLGGKAGGRSPSAVPNTSSNCKRSARTEKAVALPSPRNPGKKLLIKQRALAVIMLAHANQSRGSNPGRAQSEELFAGGFGTAVRTAEVPDLMAGAWESYSNAGDARENCGRVGDSGVATADGGSGKLRRMICIGLGWSPKPPIMRDTQLVLVTVSIFR